MKRAKLAKLFHGCLLVLLAHLPTYAAGPWEVSLETGGTIMQDPEMESGGRMKLDPGFGLTLGGTYQFQPWLKGGLEFGFLVNYIDSFGENHPHSDADLFQMPMMVNLILEPPQEMVIKPFVGVGAGGVLSVLSSRDVYYSDYWYDYGEYSSDSAIGWGAQAFAGVRWQLSENWSLGINYHFIVTEGQTWDFRDFTPGADPRYKVEVDELITHLITLSGTWSF